MRHIEPRFMLQMKLNSPLVLQAVASIILMTDMNSFSMREAGSTSTWRYYNDVVERSINSLIIDRLIRRKFISKSIKVDGRSFHLTMNNSKTGVSIIENISGG